MDNRGIALLITMVLLGTIMATAMGVAVLVAGEIGITRLVSDTMKALFAADAGLEKLFYYTNRLNGDPPNASFKRVMETGETDFTTCPSNKTCYFSCVAGQECTSDILRSRGEFNTAQRSFEAAY